MEDLLINQLQRNFAFDQFGRYALIRDIICVNRRKGEKFKILDVGGRGNILRKFLPDDDVFYVDPNVDSADENFIIGDGCDLPLNDESFDWVTSADVFEHIEPSERIKFLEEQLRVARLGIIMAAPFFSEEVRQAEINANESYRILSNGVDHIWLREHIKNGLPREDEVEAFFTLNDLHFDKFNNNQLFLWEILIGISFNVSNNYTNEIKEKFEKFNYFYNTEVYPFDSSTPSYRKIYFVKKSNKLKTLDMRNVGINDTLFLRTIKMGIDLVNFIEHENKEINQTKDKELLSLNQIVQKQSIGIQGKDQELENLNQVIQGKDQELTELNRVIWKKTSAIQRNEKEILILNRNIEEKLKTIKNRDQELMLVKMDNTEKAADLVLKEKQLLLLNQVILDRTSQIQNTEKELSSVYNSYSWKITKSFRWAHKKITGGFKLVFSNESKLRILTSTIYKLFFQLPYNKLKYYKKVLTIGIRGNGGIRNAFVNSIKVFRTEGIRGVRLRINQITEPIKIGEQTHTEFNRFDYIEWVKRYDTLSENEVKKMISRQAEFSCKPLISIIMPVFNPKLTWLEQAIESVCQQVYPHWELCIADDASTNRKVKVLLKKYQARDSRIKVVFRKKNGHISACSNSAIEISNGEWIALLDHDDLLPAHALFWVVHTINQQPQAKLIYSDEDKIDDEGNRSMPYFKCDWNQQLFYSHNLISHLGVYHAGIVKKIGGFRIGMEGSQDHDLALRFIEKIKTDEILHIPKVLYHWRLHPDSTSQSLRAKSYAQDSGVRAINDHFIRCGIDAHAEVNDFLMYRVIYRLPDPLPLVSLIIPTKDGLDLIKTCIDSILEKTTYPNYEIIIIDNNSENAETLNYLKKVQKDARIRCIRDENPFNFSALNNNAVKHAKGEYIGLINNDIEVITPGWIEEMISLASLPGIGAVGAKLYYPNNTIQHAGVILGVGGVANHAHWRFSRNDNGYFGRADLIQEYSAVTAACLIVKKDIYLQVGGLDEKNLAIAFNDVDFCIKIKKVGYRNIWTPYAELFHHESASRGEENTPEKISRFRQEVEYMMDKWDKILKNDPAYSPNLSLEFTDFSLAWPPRTERL